MTNENETKARRIAEWAIDEKLSPIIDRCTEMIKEELYQKDAALEDAKEAIEWAKMHMLSGDRVHNCRMIIGNLESELTSLRAERDQWKEQCRVTAEG